MNLMYNFYIFVTALFLSMVMVPAIRKWAFDSGAIDFPGERRTHNRAIARAGGVAIFVPFIFSILVYFDIDREVRGVLAGSLLIFFTGLIDDLYQLTPRQKFVGQISGCAVAVLVGHLYLTDLGNLVGLGNIILPVWAGGLLALIALVGVVNALNLIDGLDGLACGISVIGLMAFLWLALQEKNMAVMALAAALLGSLLGFLRYNAFPAQIFMGDTGSLAVGFLLGCLSILLTQGKYGVVNSVIPLMILSVPIIDTLVVMVGRVLKGRSPLIADRTHLHHKIMDLGLGHSFTVLLIHALALFWALLALFFRNGPEYVLLGGLLAGSIAMHLLLNALADQKNSLRRAQELRWRIGAFEWKRLFESVNKFINIFIAAVLVLYFGLALRAGGWSGWPPVGLSAVGGGVLGLVLLTSQKRYVNLFCVLSLGPVFLLNYQVEKAGKALVISGLSLSFLTNILFVLLALMVAWKFVFLKSLDRVLDISFEFILFAMGLTLAVVSSEIDLAYHLSGVVSKGIVVFLAFKFMALERRGIVAFVAIVLNIIFVLMVSALA